MPFEALKHCPNQVNLFGGDFFKVEKKLMPFGAQKLDFARPTANIGVTGDLAG
jgi:hypothetical protein